MRFRMLAYRAIENYPRIMQFMALVAALLIIAGCGAIREIPVNTVEKVVVRDSVVYINDTITVEVPRERIVEVVPALDTSYLKTSVAESVAYLDTAKRQIHHTLEQKGTVNTKIDTVVITKNIEKVVYEEVPIEVEIVKYKRDNIFWYSIIFNMMVILALIFKFYLKYIKKV